MFTILIVMIKKEWARIKTNMFSAHKTQSTQICFVLLFTIFRVICFTKTGCLFHVICFIKTVCFKCCLFLPFLLFKCFVLKNDFRQKIFCRIFFLYIQSDVFPTQLWQMLLTHNTILLKSWRRKNCHRWASEKTDEQSLIRRKKQMSTNRLAEKLEMSKTEMSAFLT